jgi:hypothetical protein
MRLCNAVLQAEHGTDFLPIDDDRPDRGNDGYLKSEKRIFAAHCFKRIQNQRLDSEILSKMTGDLKKAVNLKSQGDWEILHWTFLSNYPISEQIGSKVFRAGRQANIEVSWRGPEYFAEVLQRFKSVREIFPNLLANDVLTRLDDITKKLESLAAPRTHDIVNWVPRSEEEQQALIAQSPPMWEYLLFAGVLLQGKVRVESKWRDFQGGYGRRKGVYFDKKSSIERLSRVFEDALLITGGIDSVFTDEIEAEAFGPPGEPGNPGAIIHFAERIVATYEDLLDWASDIRGAVYPEEIRHVAELAALTAEQPAKDTRNFIDRVVDEFGRIPEWLATPGQGNLHIDLTLLLTANHAAISTFSNELMRIRSEMGS